MKCSSNEVINWLITLLDVTDLQWIKTSDSLVWSGIVFSNVNSTLPPHVKYTLRMNGRIFQLQSHAYVLFSNVKFNLE